MCLQCCVYGQQYKADVVLRNRGKVTMKASVKKKSELLEYIKFVPEMGFCQPGETMAFQIQFQAKDSSIFSKCQRHVLNRDDEVLEIPMQASRAFVTSWGYPSSHDELNLT